MSHTNRLANEKSPYLLQHARNPVDWHPWGEEAFRRAREEDRPIFLSVGYSTCHWCHVMERESFENEATAALMNELFVNVKVDREEHPDVDQIYMAAVQAVAGQGGWPMSVFLTPGLKPYYAGTYFPPESRFGRPGFPQVLQHMARVYAERRDEIESQGDRILEAIARGAETAAAAERIANRIAVVAAAKALEDAFDPRWGGFGSAPKFPRSMTLLLLLREREACRERDPAEADRLLHMVQKTLEMMWRGGIYDHLGGGFARYSVDERWLVPHFEKMLYDNALLVLAYLEAWQARPRRDWPIVVRETLDWVLREMLHPEGGFYSALDADSEGEEGLFYVWTPAELEEALGSEDAAFVSEVYGVTAAGNFEGRNVLALERSLEEVAGAAGLDRDALDARLGPLRRRLLEAREARVRPHLDDKVLTSWNGLMIAALARAGAVLDEPRYLEAARRAAVFLGERLVEGDRLLRRWRDGEAAHHGTVEDYGFLALGLFELFDATHEPRWLDAATRWTRRGRELFEDVEAGGFFFAEEGTPDLVLRMKDAYDGATPSGASAMVHALLRLAELVDDAEARRAAERAIAAYEGALARSPSAYPFLLCGLDRSLRSPTQIVVAADGDPEGGRRLIRALRARFLPDAATVFVDEDNRAALEERLPWIAGKGTLEGRAAVWICRGFACERPVTDLEDL